jgi:hypothetical protein
MELSERSRSMRTWNKMVTARSPDNEPIKSQRSNHFFPTRSYACASPLSSAALG